MIYRGYTIISRPHPTPANHSRRGYDIEADGEIIKANFAELTHCQQTIDKLITLGRLPDRSRARPIEGG